MKRHRMIRHRPALYVEKMNSRQTRRSGSRAVHIQHAPGGVSRRTDFDDAVQRIDSADAALADLARRLLVVLAADAKYTEHPGLPFGGQPSWRRGVWA